MEVNIEPFDFLKTGEVTRQLTAPSAHYINTYSHQMKVSLSLGFQNLREKLT